MFSREKFLFDSLSILSRVTKVEIDNEYYYLKKSIDKKIYRKRGLFFLQKILADIFCMKILAPTANIKKKSDHEAKKLRKLKKNGISVPKVVYSCHEYFIMEDCGENLKKLLKKSNDSIEYYLKQAIKCLANLHNLGFAHGGSQIRNFTLKDDKIYMIDFEEVIKEKYLISVQIRDILMFLISLTTLEKKINYYEVLYEYQKYSLLKTNIVSEVLEIFLKLKFMDFLYQKNISQFLGKDIFNISKLIFNINKEKQKGATKKFLENNSTCL